MLWKKQEVTVLHWTIIHVMIGLLLLAESINLALGCHTILTYQSSTIWKQKCNTGFGWCVQVMGWKLCFNLLICKRERQKRLRCSAASTGYRLWYWRNPSALNSSEPVYCDYTAAVARWNSSLNTQVVVCVLPWLLVVSKLVMYISTVRRSTETSAGFYTAAQLHQSHRASFSHSGCGSFHSPIGSWCSTGASCSMVYLATHLASFKLLQPHPYQCLNSASSRWVEHIPAC